MKKQLLKLVLLAIPAMGLLAFKSGPVFDSTAIEYFLPWVTYCANEAPDSFSTPFSTSSLGGTNSSSTSSGVLNVTTGDGATNSTGNAMWRQNFSADDPMTVVMRAKVNPDAVRNLAFSIDIDLDPERFEVQIRKYGDGDWRYNISQGYPGSGDDQNASLGTNFDPTEWHIYRFTKTGGDGSTCSIYIDENPVPLYSNTTSATGRTNTYFRFGDGWGSGTINTDFDWIVWDNTGAYSPTDQALPALDTSCQALSVSDLKSSNVWVGPIPTSDVVYVNHSTLQTATDITIYDLTGKVVKTLKATRNSDKTQVDMSQLSNGLYLVNYHDGIKTQQFKVLKQ